MDVRGQLSLAASSVRAFAHGNFIYGAGGTTQFPVPLSRSETYRYDPATNSWNDAAIADLPEGRSGAASGSYNGGWVLAGGTFNAMVLGSAVFWNPTSNTWSTLPNMLAQRANMGGAALNGSFYVVGGRSLGSTSTNNNQKLTCPPVPTPTPSPTPTPTPYLYSYSYSNAHSYSPLLHLHLLLSPAQALNISTRMRVDTGNNVLIGGFIITGSAPKSVAVRASPERQPAAGRP